MIRLSTLIRRTSFPGFESLRGPKKKKGQAEAKIESTDIVNIFKERTDPQIKNIREYPLFVQQLSRGAFSVHEFYLGIQHDNPHMMPGKANLNGYLKAWKRQRSKAFGQFKHMDRSPDIMDDNDIFHRRAVYNIGRLGAAEQAQKKKMEQDAAAAEEDEDDDE